METIASPLTSPRQFGGELFRLPLLIEPGSDETTLDYSLAGRARRNALYQRSVSQPVPPVIINPVDMPDSAFNNSVWQAAYYLGKLMKGNLPSEALSQAIFRELENVGMTASDFENSLGVAGVEDRYSHLPGWNDHLAVQSHISKFMQEGNNLTSLASKLLDIFGVDFLRVLKRES